MLQLSKNQQVTELIQVYQHIPVKLCTNCVSGILHPAQKLFDHITYFGTHNSFY